MFCCWGDMKDFSLIESKKMMGPSSNRSERHLTFKTLRGQKYLMPKHFYYQFGLCVCIFDHGFCICLPILFGHRFYSFVFYYCCVFFLVFNTCQITIRARGLYAQVCHSSEEVEMTHLTLHPPRFRTIRQEIVNKNIQSRVATFRRFDW